MLDSGKAEEISRRVLVLARQIELRKTSLDRIKRDREVRILDFDVKIKREENEIARLSKQLEELQRHLR